MGCNTKSASPKSLGSKSSKRGPYLSDKDIDNIECFTIAGLISYFSIELRHHDGRRFIRILKEDGKYGFAIGHYNKAKSPTITASAFAKYPSYDSALLAAFRCTKRGW